MKLLLLCAFALPMLAPVQPADPCRGAVSRVADAIAIMEGVRPELHNPLAISPRGRPLRYRTEGEGWSRGLRAMERRARQGHTPRSLVRVWTGHDAPEYGITVSGVAVTTKGRNAF